MAPEGTLVETPKDGNQLSSCGSVKKTTAQNIQRENAPPIQKLVPPSRRRAIPEVRLDLHDVDHVAMLVQRCALQLELHLVVVRMLFIFIAPVTADQVVLGHEIPLDVNRVHFHASCADSTICLIWFLIGE
jgi:hypothetical protein